LVEGWKKLPFDIGLKSRNGKYHVTETDSWAILMHPRLRLSFFEDEKMEDLTLAEQQCGELCALLRHATPLLSTFHISPLCYSAFGSMSCLTLTIYACCSEREECPSVTCTEMEKFLSLLAFPAFEKWELWQRQ
jgi:hypothetical protein